MFTKSNHTMNKLKKVDVDPSGMLDKHQFTTHCDDKGPNVFMVQSMLPSKNNDNKEKVLLSKTKRSFITNSKLQNCSDLSLSIMQNIESNDENIHKLSQLSQSQFKKEPQYGSRIPLYPKGHCITGYAFSINDSKANSSMKDLGLKQKTVEINNTDRTDANYFETSESVMQKNSMLIQDEKSDSNFVKKLPKFAMTSRVNNTFFKPNGLDKFGGSTDKLSSKNSVFTKLRKNTIDSNKDFHNSSKGLKDNCIGCCNKNNKYIKTLTELPRSDEKLFNSIIKTESSSTGIKCGFMNSRVFWKDKMNAKKHSIREQLFNNIDQLRNYQTKYTLSYDKLPKKNPLPNLKESLLQNINNEGDNLSVEDELATKYDTFHHNAKKFLLGLKQKEAKTFRINRNCQLDEIADQVLRANRLRKDLELFPENRRQIWKDEIKKANNMEDEAFTKRTKEFLAMNKDNFF